MFLLCLRNYPGFSKSQQSALKTLQDVNFSSHLDIFGQHHWPSETCKDILSNTSMTDGTTTWIRQPIGFGITTAV